ncbi:MAG TPA: hypothetical protein VF682_06540 [Pseudomonas sp.]
MLHRCVDGAGVVVLATQWKQFRQPDWVRIGALTRMPILFKGRNIQDCAELSAQGYLYHGIGRPVAGHCKVPTA